MKYMLTDQDIQKLIKVFVTKDDLEKAVSDLSTKADTNNVLNAVDAYAKKADTYFKEMSAIRHAINRHEEWIKRIAEKVGINLE